jgi:Arc/MetJ-type ribon-helix-helix transcriptional regulator
MNKQSKRRSERKKFTTVSIPTLLFRKVEERIKGTGFTSVSSYVTYVLREIAAEEDEEAEKPFTKEDEERVKARLRALGYID